MKNFIDPINRKEFVNEFGETMTLVMSSDLTVWIHHNDCNDDFETADIFCSEYILNSLEQRAIIEFIFESHNITIL